MIEVKIQDEMVKCNTDVSMFKGENAIVNAALEIKGIMFSVMTDEFVKLVDQTKKSPTEVAHTMCEVIGCDPKEFGDFIKEVFVDGND